MAKSSNELVTILDQVAELLDGRGNSDLAAEVDLVVPMFLRVRHPQQQEAPEELLPPSMPQDDYTLDENPMGLPDVPTGHENGHPAPMGIKEPEWVPPAGLTPHVPCTPQVGDGIVNLDPGKDLQDTLLKVFQEYEARTTASFDVTAGIDKAWKRGQQGAPKSPTKKDLEDSKDYILTSYERLVEILKGNRKWDSHVMFWDGPEKKLKPNYRKDLYKYLKSVQDALNVYVYELSRKIQMMDNWASNLPLP